MDELPLVPKTKPAWVACLILIVALFLYYYTFLYQPLLTSYKQQNLVIPYSNKATESVTKELEIHLITPQFLGGDSVPFVTVSIRNFKPQVMHLKLRLSWAPQNPISDYHDLSIIALSDNIQPAEVDVQVQPHSYAFVQIPLIFLGNSLDLEHELFILTTVVPLQGHPVTESLSANIADVNAVVSRINSSLYFILKNLLLPPLANGLLPALAIMCCWFVEHENEEPEITLRSVIEIFLKAAVYALMGITLFFLIETTDENFYEPLLLISLVISCVGTGFYVFINFKGYLKSRKVISERLRICRVKFGSFVSKIPERINSFSRRQPNDS
jgi:hypothetical protein